MTAVPCAIAAALPDNPWTSEDPELRKQVRPICWRCPMRLACAKEALALKITFGIWGGWDCSERRQREAMRSAVRAVAEQLDGQVAS